MEHFRDKAKQIKLLILDVDGVLTSGIIYYGSNEIEMKGFHLHDGLGIKLLQRSGIPVAIISGKNSEPVARRIQELNIQHAYLGYEEKLPAYEDLKQKLGIKDEHIAYIGDDLPDLPLLRRVGFPVTVSEAPAILKQHADYITKNPAGKGAVREVCELILDAQGKLQSVIQSYLN